MSPETESSRAGMTRSKSSPVEDVEPSETCQREVSEFYSSQEEADQAHATFSPRTEWAGQTGLFGTTFAL